MAVPGTQGGGRWRVDRIIALAAKLRASAGIPSYVASKHGVIGLGKALAIELAGDWIPPTSCSPATSRHPCRTTSFIMSLATGQGGLDSG